MFTIREKENRYYLSLKNKEEDITSFLNKWDQISDFNESVNFFLVQVNELGSKNILKNLTYEHINWKDTKRDVDHGKVKPRDILLVYFARQAIDFKQQLKMVYRVESVSEGNKRFTLTELKNFVGIPYTKIRGAVSDSRLSDSFRKIGQQGFNIIQISQSDYKSILLLENEIEPLRQISLVRNPTIWVVRAGEKGKEEKGALDNNLVTIE